MTALTALFSSALLASPLGPPSLDEALASFARGDFAAAEAQALAVAQPPQEGAALYLAGLARFRAGRAPEALQALEQAARASDAPPAALWHYNRASCLYELGRFAEAEADYEKAASLDASLAGVSLANAGFAALDAGALDRARALAARAKAVASGATSALVADLEAHLAASGGELATSEYKEGLSAFDAGRYAEARDRFHRAAELDRGDGKSRVMSGAAALQLGDRGEARRDLTSALRLPLGPADAEAARDYLDALSHGLPARGRGLEGVFRLGAGYDSDALQTGFSAPNEFPGTGASLTPSALTTADLAVAYRSRPAGGLFTELTYAFDQLAYLAPDAADRSLQQHTLTFSAEHALREDLRLGGSATGQLAFTGLGNFRGLQASAGAGGFFALDESDASTTRLDLEYTRKAGLSEFGYLTGDRLDAALTHELRLAGATLGAGYRFRAELIGTSATAAYVDPFGYLGHTLSASLRGKPSPRLLVELSAGIEWRGYLHDNYRLLGPPGGGGGLEIDRRRRQDTRYFAGAAASLSLTRALSLTLRYDLVVNQSNVAGDASDGPGGQCGPGGACHRFDGDNRSYDKHVISLGTALAW